MHLDLTVSLGNIVTLGSIIAAFLAIDRRLSRYAIEHEMLIGWYCKAHNMRMKDLPTRSQ